MSDGYFCVTGRSEYEIVINRSRFITTLVPIENAEQAFDEIKKISKKYSDATHNCYAFVSNRENTEQRFSDDGEPQGTAGMPILGVLKAKELRETAVAVVRYFGGIKLGAGGLTRAYSSSAAEALDRAAVCEYAVCTEVTVRVAYPEVNALTRFLEGRNVLSREFSEKAVFIIAVREEETDGFCAQCADVLLGRAEILRGRSYFSPFPLEK